MLVNFRVENFKSFKDFTEFSMEATKLKNLKESNTFMANNITLLKSAVVYGANASGKSNLKIAMTVMKNIVLDSVSIEKMTNYPHSPFLLNSEMEKQSSIFEIEFIIENSKYKYGFSIKERGVIDREWLYQKKLQAGSKEVVLFKRDETDFKIGTNYKESKGLKDKTRENALFLTVVAQFNGVISTKILEWFNKFHILSNVNNEPFKTSYLSKLEEERYKNKIVSFVKSADMGIYDIKKEKVSFEEMNLDKETIDLIPKNMLENIKENSLAKIDTVHIQYDKDGKFKKLKSFDLDLESEGTKKFLSLSVPIIDALLNGEILVIDELDNSLHTELVKAIINMFNSKETNPNNAQLIFTTHDTNLLDQKLFRRDQIWFTEKDIYGATKLYSLVEYGKGSARNDLALEKNYLEGKFGAKPHIGSLAFEVD